MLQRGLQCHARDQCDVADLAVRAFVSASADLGTAFEKVLPAPDDALNSVVVESVAAAPAADGDGPAAPPPRGFSHGRLAIERGNG